MMALRNLVVNLSVFRGGLSESELPNILPDWDRSQDEHLSLLPSTDERLDQPKDMQPHLWGDYASTLTNITKQIREMRPKRIYVTGLAPLPLFFHFGLELSGFSAPISFINKHMGNYSILNIEESPDTSPDYTYAASYFVERKNALTTAPDNVDCCAWWVSTNINARIKNNDDAIEESCRRSPLALRWTSSMEVTPKNVDDQFLTQKNIWPLYTDLYQSFRAMKGAIDTTHIQIRGQHGKNAPISNAIAVFVAGSNIASLIAGLAANPNMLGPFHVMNYDQGNNRYEHVLTLPYAKADTSDVRANTAQNTPPSKNITLCLSGGGFRATLFHLGIIKFMQEAGYLQNVKKIYSVSGGSLLAAHMMGNWSNYLEGNESTIKKLIELCQTDLTKDFEKHLLDDSKKQVKILDTVSQYIKPPADEQSLPADVEFNILFSELSRSKTCKCYYDKTERSFRIRFLESASAKPIDFMLAKFNDNYKVHEKSYNPIAVAAVMSASFPLLLPPIAIPNRETTAKKSYFCADAGILDNLAIRELLISPQNFANDDVIICDAAAALMELDHDAKVSAIGSGLRAIDAMMRDTGLERIAALPYGKHPIIPYHISFVDPHPHTHRPIQQRNVIPPSSSPSRLKPEGIAQEIAAAVPKLPDMRTDLNRFTDTEVDLLVLHGYVQAWRALNPAWQPTNLRFIQSGDQFETVQKRLPIDQKTSWENPQTTFSKISSSFFNLYIWLHNIHNIFGGPRSIILLTALVIIAILTIVGFVHGFYITTSHISRYFAS